MLATDTHQRSQNLHHLYLGMRLKWVVFMFFLLIKIIAIRKVLMSLHLLQCEREAYAAWHAKILDTLVLHLYCVRGRQNPKTPKLSFMADAAITRGGIGGVGSLVYICGDSRGACSYACSYAGEHSRSKCKFSFIWVGKQ